MKYAIYARVSTDEQTVSQQIEELRSVIDRIGDAESVETFTDTASGAKISRVGLDALMKAVRAGRVDVVVTWKLDRLGRSLPHLAQMFGEFESLGVAIMVPSQGIDTRKSNPAGKLILGVLSAIAEFERAIISERTRLKLAHLKARGRTLGRPSSLAGLIVSYQAALRHRGVARLSVREAARALKCSVGTASKVIKTHAEMVAEGQKLANAEAA